jgi:hypothetical protein
MTDSGLVRGTQLPPAPDGVRHARSGVAAGLERRWWRVALDTLS